MSDQDVFENKPADQQIETVEKEQVAPSTTIDVFVDKLMSIKREDGNPKYDSLEKALDALAESQSYIPQLQQENAGYKQQLELLSKKLTEAESLESIVKRMNPVEQEQPAATAVVSTPNQDDATVEQKIEQLLSKREAEKIAVANLTKVNDALTGKFGDNVYDVVTAKAKELGITNDEFKLLAAKSPSLVLGHFGAAPTTPNPTSSSVNMHNFNTDKPRVGKPEKSLIAGSGANDRVRAEYMRKIREEVYADLGVSE